VHKTPNTFEMLATLEATSEAGKEKTPPQTSKSWVQYLYKNKTIREKPRHAATRITPSNNVFVTTITSDCHPPSLLKIFVISKAIEDFWIQRGVARPKLIDIQVKRRKHGEDAIITGIIAWYTTC